MIEKYSFGKIIVNGVTYTNDIKIIKGAVIPEWWRKRGHQVAFDDVKDILGTRPDILVIGKGRYGMMKVASPLREHLLRKGIELIENSTSASIETFNQLYEEGLNVAAGFHLTC